MVGLNKSNAWMTKSNVRMKSAQALEIPVLSGSPEKLRNQQPASALRGSGARILPQPTPFGNDTLRVRMQMLGTASPQIWYVKLQAKAWPGIGFSSAGMGSRSKALSPAILDWPASGLHGGLHGGFCHGDIIPAVGGVTG